jgi:hypothetical protein
VEKDRCARGDVERLDEAGAGNGDDLIARLERRARQSMLFVTKHQGEWPFGPVQRVDRLPILGCSSDHAIALTQPLQRVGKPDTAMELHKFQPTFGDAVARVRWSCLRRMVRQHYPRKPEESGGPGNRSEIVRISNAVQQQQWLAAAGLACDFDEQLV